QQSAISSQERSALLSLRSSLGLRAKEWPIKLNPCTSWVGIQCNSNGSVTGINISGFKRTRLGKLNPQFSVDPLQNLPHLASFNASNFLLPGPIPAWFGSQLPSLRILDLRYCSVNGPIPATLGNLSSLVELYISGNNITGNVPSSLGQLFRLSVLDISQNFLTGTIPLAFLSLQNLTLLSMSSNFLSGVVPPGIGLLSKLQFLNFSGNSLSSSIPASLGNLSSLVELDLGFNSFYGSLPSDVSGLRSLKKMVVGNNLLSGSLSSNIFQPLTGLQLLVLSQNHFSGDFPAAIWSIPSLQYLDASANNFSSMLPNGSFGVKLPSAVFNLSNNLLYGNLTPVIRRFAFIDLSGNYFEGPVPLYALGNTSLVANCLRNTTNQRTAAACSAFYDERNLVFDNFGEANVTEPAKSRKSHRKAIILASVLGGVGLMALLILIIVLICRRRRKATSGNSGVEAIPPAGNSPGPGLPLNLSTIGDAFTYQQILRATGDLSDLNLVKHGHSGDIFSGKVDGAIPVIVKRINLQSSVKKDGYIFELEVFSKFSHPRLVPLVGHCLESESEKFLVYKRMPNGDLTSCLFKKKSPEDDSLQSLDWITRLKIAIGTAEALCYLHHECTPPVVHRDVQASSILLDDKYEVRLGSLSDACYHEGDSHPKRITRLLRLPQSLEQGSSGRVKATCAYDVYCFGKVLLELVTGKIGLSSSSDSHQEFLESTLPHISIYDKDSVTNIVDPSLIIDEDLLEEVWAMAIVARSCLNPKPVRRPLMRYILKALENPLKVVRQQDKEAAASSSSARLRTTSSRGSWNAAFFGSWRHSSSDVAPPPAFMVGGSSSVKMEGPSGSSFKEAQGSQGSGNGGYSSSKRYSNEIFPEPVDDQNLQRR
ncbi:hypothetical protein M569_13196, partial [Genlisea aurea]